MEGFSGFYVALAVAMCLAATVLGVGILLIVLGVRKTVKGENRIGRIVAGGIISFFAAVAFLAFGMIGVMGYSADKQATSPENKKYTDKITDAFEDEDPYDLAKVFADVSYSGDIITAEDAEELFDSLDGDIVSVSHIIKSTYFHNKYTVVEYSYLVSTNKGITYTVSIACMTKSPEDEYLGVQYIKVMLNKKTVCEYGEKPDFD